MDVLETKYVPLVRLQVVKERFLPYGQEELVSPETVVKMVSRLLEGADKECMLVIPVDSRGKPVGVEFVAVGSLNRAHVPTREIFKHAIVSNAAGVFLVHNHPSGDVQPSDSDWQLTRRVQKAGDLLGLEVYDHIVIGEDGTYFSMAGTHKWHIERECA